MVYVHRTNVESRKQPWSTYAVYQTTLLQWAFFWDFLLLHLYYSSTAAWSHDARMLGLIILLSWMLMSKFLKLLGHYIRHPVDFLLLPVSIMFGYLHGLIKAKAMLSLNVVSWPAVSLPSVNDDVYEPSGIPPSRTWLRIHTDRVGYPRWRGRRRQLPYDQGQSKATGGRPRFLHSRNIFLPKREMRIPVQLPTMYSIVEGRVHDYKKEVLEVHFLAFVLIPLYKLPILL